MLLVAVVSAAETLQVSRDTHVLSAPVGEAEMIGRIPEGGVVVVDEHVDGEGCEDWALLLPYGYACVEGASPTEKLPHSLPDVVTFDPPEPEEYWNYLDTGDWDRSEPAPLVPYVYGRRYRSWKAPIYASAEAFEAGEDPVSRLGSVRKFAFVEVVATSRGEVLARADGSVVPVGEVYLYPISRHVGWDLEHAPLEDGWVVGWAVNYEGAPLYDEVRGQELELLPYHEPVQVRAAAGGWFEVADRGFMRASDLRYWTPAPAPKGVGNDQVWVDIDRDGQVLGLRRGEQLLYVTLVSTGEDPDHTTPLGLFEVQRKFASADMSSGPNAEEPYYVEKVPWTLFYSGPYALHGVFWHWGFGRVASHGCVNVAPQDAQRLYEELDPAMPRGWDLVHATDEHPGSLVRVRSGTNINVPDRRR